MPGMNNYGKPKRSMAGGRTRPSDRRKSGPAMGSKTMGSEGPKRQKRPLTASGGPGPRRPMPGRTGSTPSRRPMPAKPGATAARRPMPGRRPGMNRKPGMR